MNKNRIKRLEQTNSALNDLNRSEHPLFLFLECNKVHTPKELVRGLERALKLPPQNYEASEDKKSYKIPIDSPLVERYDPDTANLIFKNLSGQFLAVDFEINLNVE